MNDYLKTKPEDGKELSSSSTKKAGFKKPMVPAITASDGEESDISAMSGTSLLSTASDLTGGSRKRGRKKNEGDPNPKRGKRVSVLKERAKTTDEDEVFDPSVLPSKGKAKANLPSADDLEKEMGSQPSEALVDLIKVHLDTVEKIADKSKNLKGDFARGLRVAARRSMAASLELMQRTSANANEERLERQNAELNAKLAALSAEVGKLTEQINCQQALLQARAANTAKPAATSPVAGGKEWEENLMKRVVAVIDGKVAAAIKATTTSRGRTTAAPTKPGPSGIGGATESCLPAPGASKPTARSQPSVAMPASEAAWSTVVKRGKGAKKMAAAAQPAPKASHKSGSKAGPKGGPMVAQRAGLKAGLKPKPARLPTTAAITVTIPEGSEVTLAAVMTAAKAKINLDELGVENLRPKRTITGGLMLEVSGPDCTSKADALAERMRVDLADMGVRIARPVKTGELRLKDLDDSIAPEEVAAAVSKAGGCSVEDVRVGEIRRSPTALGTAWVRCPLAAVRKLAAAKHVLVGWVNARVDYLSSRPLQCFRCLEYGHVRSMCQSAVDRSNLCYACGEPDHRASQCTRPQRCPLCSDMGTKADHRMGSKKCSPPKKGKRTPVPPAPATGRSAAPTEVAAESCQDPLLAERGSARPEEPMEDS